MTPKTMPRTDAAVVDKDGRLIEPWRSFLEGVTQAGRGLNSTSAAIAALPATAAQYQDNSAGVLLGPNAVWDAAAFEALTDAATIAIDMSLLFNMSVTIAGNRTLGNPTIPKVGQSGCIAVTASGGTRTLSKGSNWKSNDITWPISIASGTTTYVFYFVFSSTVILVTGLMANPA